MSILLDPHKILADLHLVYRDEASRSLGRYLQFVTIDSRPSPRRWADLRETWQGDLVRPMIPAIEAAAGMRPNFDGVRRFWRTLPRGHDKTGLIARICNWCLEFAPQQMQIVAAAVDRDQARLLRDAIDRERELNPWLTEVKVNRYDAHGPGGDLEILSNDVGSSSGQKADLIVMDELTWWKNRDLFDVLLAGLTKRQQAVIVVITNAGIVGSWQHDVLKTAQRSPFWDVLETPVGVRPASWINQAEVDADRMMMTRGTAARSYDNLWTDSADNPLFPADLVAACSVTRSSILWADPTKPPTGPKNLLLGYDVGQNDRAALWILERTAPRTYVTRVLEVTQGVSLAQQEARIRAIIRAVRHRLVAGQIDQGSIGYQVAETLSREFPGLIVPISCGPQWQGRAALAVHLAGRERRLILPGLETGDADPQLVADFGQVEQVGDRKDGTPEVSTLRTDAGHADRFWGLAIAMDADATPSRPQAKGARTG